MKMPRIDPLQLLNCLRVLLSPSGGIKSKEEVERLASLMTKFSKKLVSKCIYVQILKITEPGLLGEFMGAGGWNLAHQWLSVAIMSQNLPFIKELLELLLICPVDVERLKANNCPKLIKNLTKEASNEEVRQLASRLVDQWLCIVKGLAPPLHQPSPVLAPAPVSSPVPVSTVVMDLPAIQLPIVIFHPEPAPVPAPDVVAATSADSELAVCVNEPDEMITEAEFIEGQSQEEVKCEVVPAVTSEEATDVADSAEDNSASDCFNGTLPVYKITIRDGKQVLAKVTNSERAPRKQVLDSASIRQDFSKTSAGNIVKEQYDSIIKRRATEEQQKSVAAKVKSIKTDPSDVKRVAKDVNKKMLEKSLTERKIKLVEPSKDKPFEATNEKDRQRERKERELNKLKERKAEKAAALAEKAAAQVEKDKATLAKLVPPPISKLGKIPKKPRLEESKSTDSKKEEKKPEHKRSPLSPDVKRPSVDSRKPVVNGRPKTVKVLPSKFRSTGLEEEIKPPTSKPRRSSSERKSSLSSSSRPEKRTSPIKDGPPAEKKAKVVPETPPPAPAEEPKKVDKPIVKPKRIQLTESDMFMDALTASTKKDVRKRKRKVSTSRDGTEPKKETKDDTPPGSPTNSEDNMSPIVSKPPPRFYRETLEDDSEKEIKKEPKTEIDESSAPGTEEAKENKSVSPLREDSEQAGDKAGESATEAEDDTPAGRYPRGVLVHHRKKGPKKAVRWRPEKELAAIQFFELDETERVNVTKTFTDAKQNERTTEREAFQLARKLPQDDNMEERTAWKFPALIDLPKAVAEWGEKSEEKAIQYARESSVLSALYFTRASIPDTAAEPDSENHPARDPVVIPLEDPANNPESVMDHRSKGWPEPKPMLAPTSPLPAAVFPPAAAIAAAAVAPQFQPFGAPAPGFNGMPPGMFPPGNMGPGPGMGPMGGDWRTGDGRVIPMDSAMPMDMYNQQGGPAMNMNMPGNMQGPGGMPMGNGPPMDMNYGMMPPTDEMGNQFPMQGFPMGPNMGPNMGGPPMFPPFQQRNMGPNNMRGNRNMGPRGQWFRPNGPNMPNGPNGQWQGGRGGPRPWVRGVCHAFSARGSCRKGADCTYTH